MYMHQILTQNAQGFVFSLPTRSHTSSFVFCSYSPHAPLNISIHTHTFTLFVRRTHLCKHCCDTHTQRVSHVCKHVIYSQVKGLSLCTHRHTHPCEHTLQPTKNSRPDLLDEGVCSVGAEQQDGSAQRVSVAVELLSPHGGEEVGEDFADVPVDSLQGHVYALTGRLVQETLQATNVCRNGRRKIWDHCPRAFSCRDTVRGAWKYEDGAQREVRHILNTFSLWMFFLLHRCLRHDTTSALKIHEKMQTTKIWQISLFFDSFSFGQKISCAGQIVNVLEAVSCDIGLQK